ncbi:MAG: phospholipid carrier-dependent glycosyltransferase [Planctomycetaceae bacterium]
MNRAGAGLIVFFVCVYLLPLNARQLAIPDEMRYGEISREMIASGDFIVPRLNGLRYFEKPAGGHILNACAMLVFGETNFAVRFMSVVATAFSAAAIYLLVARYQSSKTALLAAFIFLTCAEVLGIGTFSVLDSMLSGCVTLSICCFYEGIVATGKRRIGWLVLSGVFAGGAFLVKGFIAFAVPVVVIGPYLAWRREWKALLTLTWIPLVVAAIVSLPWSLAIASKEPDFWRYFFWEEHIRRYFYPGGGQHKFPFWFFVPVFVCGTLPWSLLGPLPLRDLIRRRKAEPFIQFSVVWTVMPFLFFSCSSGKLGTYILPCFAPFSILLAIALTDRFDEGHPNRSLQTGASLMVAIAVLSLITTGVIALLNAFGILAPLDVDYISKTIGWGIGLSISLGLSLTACRVVGGVPKTVFTGLAAAAIFVTGSFCVPTEISANIGIHRFLESEQHRIETDSIVVADIKTIHAVCYVYKRIDVQFFGAHGEVAYGLSYPEAANRSLEVPELASLISQRGTRPLAMILQSEPEDTWRHDLPEPGYQAQWNNIWFAFYPPQPEGEQLNTGKSQHEK